MLLKESLQPDPEMKQFGDRGHLDEEKTVDELRGVLPNMFLSCCNPCIMGLMGWMLRGQGTFEGATKEQFKRDKAEANSKMGGWVALPDSNLKGVRCVEVTYPSHLDAFENTAYLYSPVEPSPSGTKRPVVAFFHGGGWCFGTCREKPNHDFCADLCRMLQCYIMSADYRLAPEHPFPTGAEDCYSSLIFLGQQHDQHSLPADLDAERTVVIGISAGGNLAAVAAMMCRDRQPKGVKVVHQVLIAPCFFKRPLTNSRMHASMRGAFILPPWFMVWFEEMYTPEGSTPEQLAQEPYACPESASDLAGLPHLTGLVGGADILRDEAVAYFKAVAAAGGAVEWRQWDRAPHALGMTTNRKSVLDYTVARVTAVLGAEASAASAASM